MSDNIYRVEIPCEGGCEYGGCSHNNVIILRYIGVADVWDLHRIYHVDTDNPSVKSITSMDDKDIQAIRDAIDMKNHTGCTDKEWEPIKNK